MNLNPVASWVLVIWYIVGSLIITAATAGMAFALFKLNAELDKLTAKIDPLLEKVDKILVVATEKVDSIGSKTDDILDEGNIMVHNVHGKVEKTASVVQRTIHAPIIGLNSFAAGFSRGMETFGRLQRQESKVQRVTHSDHPNQINASGDGQLRLVESSASGLNGEETRNGR